MTEKIDFKSGVTSTKRIRLSLIPHMGLLNVAARFELGIEEYKEKAWNNLKSNQDALKDEEWLIERCSHAIEHCYSLIDFLTHKHSNVKKALGDAGAIGWCGLVLGEALSSRGIADDHRKQGTMNSANMLICKGCHRPYTRSVVHTDPTYCLDCLGVYNAHLTFLFLAHKFKDVV